MFGRRRRAAPVPQVPAPELSDEQVFDLLHGKLADLLGAQGQWTLVPRRGNDTDVIFHSMKAHEIAAVLTWLLRKERAALRGEHIAEPSALPWTPAPITVWAEPDDVPVPVPVRLPVFPSVESMELARLVA